MSLDRARYGHTVHSSVSAFDETLRPSACRRVSVGDGLVVRTRRRDGTGPGSLPPLDALPLRGSFR